MNFKKHHTSNSNKNNNHQYFVINKTGYVLKEHSVSNETPELSNLPAQTRDLVYNDIKNDIKGIHNLIDGVYEETCDLIQMENSLSTPYDLSIEIIIGRLSYELLKLLNPLALKIYRRFLIRLAERGDFDNTKEAKKLLSSLELPDNEIYGKIKTWVYKLENWILGNINSSLNENETSKSINKNFFSDVFDNIKELFDKVKTKINTFISYALSAVYTKTDQFKLKEQGIREYEIVQSGNSNCCEHCQEMAGKIYNVDKLKIGENAPPFHLNCNCKIEGKKTYADITEPMVLDENLESYDRDAAINYAIYWHNKFNPNYPNFSSSGDCANFVSQCLKAGGFQMNEYWHCYPRNVKEVNPIYALIINSIKWSYTPAWSAAKDQYEYLKNSNIVTGETIISNPDDVAAAINDPENPVKVGDVMYLQWEDEHPHHATIISKIENDMIHFAAHTDPYDEKPLYKFFNEKKNGTAYILKIK
ncbi:MAG: amidase domain-containing protein [Clostridia bacterium]|nr:amidase domain-containing protein [Clostridia bacterium]